GRDALGGDPARDTADRGDRYLRGARPRLRAGARRDHGAGDAHREFEPAEPVPLLAGQHARRAPGAELPRGRSARGPGAHVRGARPARHHLGGQHRRRHDHELRDEERSQVSPALPAVEGRATQIAGAQTVAPSLRRSPWEARALRSEILTVGAWIAAIVASVPLFSVLYMLIVRGGARLSWEVLVELPPAGFEMGGGFGNASVRSLVMVGLGALISVPVGIAGAVFLAELGPNSSLAGAVRFAAKTLTGLPSILAGVFAYASVVLVTGTYSAPAGAVALAVLMVPTVLLTAEEAMKMVPRITKD